MGEKKFTVEAFGHFNHGQSWLSNARFLYGQLSVSVQLQAVFLGTIPELGAETVPMRSPRSRCLFVLLFWFWFFHLKKKCKLLFYFFIWWRWFEHTLKNLSGCPTLATLKPMDFNSHNSGS
uniref:Uncharacterized protein n=1 Tax=Micrurus carvalhoi TaxID=3147026 RepID=A0A2H6NC78_9SAUR